MRAYSCRSSKVSFAGKTGTAVFFTEEHTTDQVSFCGYFPADRPLYSCIVVMQRPNIWGSQSGDVFRNIVEQVMFGVDHTEHLRVLLQFLRDFFPASARLQIIGQHDFRSLQPGIENDRIGDDFPAGQLGQWPADRQRRLGCGGQHQGRAIMVG